MDKETLLVTLFWIVIMAVMLAYNYWQHKKTGEKWNQDKTERLTNEFLEHLPQNIQYSKTQIELMFRCWCFASKLSDVQIKKIRAKLDETVLKKA